MRVGWGLDAHRFGGSGPLLLAGVAVSDRGLEGTSDADVLAHAVADALLGAAALGDLGMHYPSSDPQWEGADSLALLADVVDKVAGAGFRVVQVDTTVVAQSIRVGPYRQAIRERLGYTLGLETGQVSVKATTTDHMGFIGRDEGMAAIAVVVLEPLR